MPKLPTKILSLDTETTGVDKWHGARPYLVTFCDANQNNTFYEWDVDPLTRKVRVIQSDVEEIAHAILTCDTLVLQNCKFDFSMLQPLMPEGFDWPWEKVHDTLIAGHLLASNHAHDLTSMGIEYLGIDIGGYEALLEVAVQKCRNLVRRKGSPIGDWRIAKSGLPEMPSAKEKCWKFDTWLPRTVIRFFDEKLGGQYVLEGLDIDKSVEESWLTVANTYANADSALTLPLHLKQVEIIKERGLWEIYQKRLTLLPVVYGMEQRGVSINKARTDELIAQYRAESTELGWQCVGMAASYGHELSLPKSGNNKSLTTFVFDVLNLSPVISSSKNKKTDKPSLDKRVLEHYEDTLPPRSKELTFIKKLRAKRKRDTAISYQEGYQKYWMHVRNDWYVLHPNLNITGSDTLRFSSNHPNEQNISKQEVGEGDKRTLRWLFGPEPGREWWSLDAKNIELRLPAYLSEEQELIDLFEHPDDPPYYGSTHLLNFHTVYPDIWGQELSIVGLDKVGPHCKKKYAATWYQYCKNGGFACQYGAVDREDGQGTADRAFHRPGSHARLKARFGRLEKLNQLCIAFASKHGYIETIKMKGANHGYPLMCSRSQWGNIKPTIPLNYKIQGSAMEWMGHAMVRCQRWLDEYNAIRLPRLHAWIVLQVHDELVFDFPASKVSPLEERDVKGATPFRHSNLWAIKQLAGEMEKGGDDIGIPTPVGIEYNQHTWSEGVTI